jgi:hypothetical protein
MTAVDVGVTRSHHRSAKLFKIARHRVLRWFRPPKAELVRQRIVPHPMPAVAAGTPIGKEERREQHA